MRISIIYFAAIIMIYMKTGCQPVLHDASEVEVSWELISNTYSEQAQAKAVFVIRNHSGFHFTDRNWELYYNQAPRRILSSGSDPSVKVEWINGDWFRLVPEEGFSLRKGEEVAITYEASAWWIKESDAPMGLYLVLYDRSGRQERIMNITNYRVLPFEREEQVSRHRHDMTPLPDPAWRYGQNLAMALLPPEALKRVVPTPVRVSSGGERVVFTEPVDIIYGEGLKGEADYLAGLLRGLTGENFRPFQGDEERPNSILLRQAAFAVNGTDSEAYRLEVRRNRNIVITGTDAAGVFYGLQTLTALLPASAYAGGVQAVELEVMTIEDAPRFPYRGIHLDVARNFQDKQTLLKFLDVLAFYKINTLHLHLTEDEGWRLEIRTLPELTEVGGQREHPKADDLRFNTSVAELLSGRWPVVHPAYGSGPFAYGEGSHGSGYYTHDDFVEILRYAAARHIRVIPEVNLPGHARAAIVAMEKRYQRLMAEGREEAANEYRLIDPEETSVYLSAQSFTDNVINVARASVYHFFETVVDGIISIYEEAGAPLEIFHTGGDEVPVGAWTASPMAEELLKGMPWVGDPKNLQAYFFEKAIGILSERGLKVAGWEEVALLKDESGRYNPNPAFADGTVIPYIWNSLWGNQDLGYRLANMGYPVVQCHVSNFYFDLAYDKDPKEPGLYWAGFVAPRDAWYYDPFNMFNTTLRTAMGAEVDIEQDYAHMERLRPAARERVLGLQAQLWSETILGPDMLEYYLLPKMLGFAESAWAAERSFERIAGRAAREEEAQRKWNVFANTMAQQELPRLAYMNGGYNYRLPLPGAVVEGNMLMANIEYPGLTIRYTTDGEEPTLASPAYTEPVEVSGTVKLKAFDGAGRSSRVVVLNP